jgi:hypothetical protein
MERVLHLWSGRPGTLAAAVAALTAPGEAHTVVCLHGASAPPVPDTVPVRRLPGDLDYPALLELVFAADRVVAW